MASLPAPEDKLLTAFKKALDCRSECPEHSECDCVKMFLLGGDLVRFKTGLEATCPSEIIKAIADTALEEASQ